MKRNPWKMGVAILFVILIVGVDGYFGNYVLTYVSSNPIITNPVKTSFPLYIPMSFNYYYGNASNPTGYNPSPNFVFTIWLTGRTPVNNTILAGEPFTISGRAVEANSHSPLNDTRVIKFFFQDILAWPPSNTTSGLANGADVILCQGGRQECVSCTPTQCKVPIEPTATANSYWTTLNNTFYFPFSGQFSPVVQFVTQGFLNKTFQIITAYAPQLGNVALNVQPTSLAQDAQVGNTNLRISNATLILTYAILFFGIIESLDVIARVIKWGILQR